jgi:hypothetical protein
MYNCGVNAGDRVCWCPICGTIRTGKETPTDAVPLLVPRCRKFAESFDEPLTTGMSLWRTLGIAESINLPENRS